MTKDSPIEPELSIVIPVYNNETTLKPLCLRIFRSLDGIIEDYEVILVNDDSQDHSAAVIESLESIFDQVHGLQLARNMGQNLALFEGFKKSRGSRIVVMDADLQDVPEHLPQLIAALDDHTDSAFIKRIGSYQAGKRMISSRIFKGFLQLLTGLHRQAGTYFITQREVVDKMTQFNARYPIMTVMVYSFSKRVKYVEAQRNNNEGTSSYTFLKRCYYAYRATYCALQCRWMRAK